MELKESTYKAYSGIAKYCRSGNEENIQNLGLRQDRMPHYRRLVFNITKNTLKQAYPITYKLLTDTQWIDLVQDYFENHNAQEYRIWMMPKEFYQFVVDENYSEKYQIPFINDLMLFEWIEIEVHTMPDEDFPQSNKNGDLWNQNLVLMPEFRLLQLEYPVHLKQTSLINESDRANYFLLAYRNIKDKGVRFMNLSVLFAYCIEQIEQGETLKNIVDSFCELTQSVFDEGMKSKTESFVLGLIEKGLILGYQ